MTFDGRTQLEIADQLGISQVHVSRIIEKLEHITGQSIFKKITGHERDPAAGGGHQ